MNRKLFFTLIFALFCFSHDLRSETRDDEYSGAKTVLDQKLPESVSLSKHKEKRITFDFESSELVDIVNMLAAEKNVNVILPLGVNAINAKVTLHMTEQLTLTQAWQMLYTLLNVAGYSLIDKDGTYTIVKIAQDITRETTPIYVGVEPDQLPDFEKQITYIYYFEYLKVPEKAGVGGAGGTGELEGFLNTLLPAPALIQYEPAANAVIIRDMANNIRSAMSIIKEFDKPGFKESYDILQLNYTKASEVEKLLNVILVGSVSPRDRFNIRKPDSSSYFPQGTRILAEPRTNRLLMFGPRSAIELVKDFVQKQIDVRLSDGKSIFHTYSVKYLDARNLADVLNRIIDPTSAGGTGQSRAEVLGGTERFFEGVIIKSDDVSEGKSGDKAGIEHHGSNKLIVAARNDDWIQLEKIIEKLDRPQAMVVIEVLIVDLQLIDERLLGNMMRNPKAIPLPRIGDSVRSVEFQSEQISPGQIVTNRTSDSTPSALLSTIAYDLAKFTGFVDNAYKDIDILAGLAAGSTAVTISDNDGKVWDILQVLQSYGHTKVLSHPHVITVNNKEAIVSIGEDRLVPGEVSGSSSGATTIKQEAVKANLAVKITPRISEETVMLKIDIDISEFVSSALTNANANVRTIKTAAAVWSGDVLALGGLIKDKAAKGRTGTPLLESIPIIGWLFKKRNSENTKNNLTVFIRPTIIKPKLRGGIGVYSEKYIDLAKSYAKEGTLFDSMRDPINRWFFREANDVESEIAEFKEIYKETEKVFDAPKAPSLSPQVASTKPAAITREAQKMQQDALSSDSLKLAQSTGHKKEKKEKKKNRHEVSAKLSRTHQPEQVEQLKKLLEQETNPLLAQQQIAG